VSRLERELRDGRARVTGSLEMTVNFAVDGMLHAKVVRSVVPHGIITEVDIEDALDSEGVVAVVTGADLVERGLDPYFGAVRKDQPILAVDKVRYAGDPVAVVIAETLWQAEAAAELVFIDYEELAYVVDAEAAGEADAPQLHDAYPGNECGDWRLHHGDVDAALADAYRVYRATYRTPTASHVPMEPHVAVARWAEDRLEVWTSAQAPHAVVKGLQGIFHSDDVVVRTHNLGGAYGAKGQIKIEPIAACAALFAEAPVKLELSRDEVFATIGRHAGAVHLTTAVDREGKLIARDIDVVYNAGAYAVMSPGAAGQGLIRAPGPYRIPNVRARSRARYTNTVPTGPFRGAMTSQVCLAYEAQLDEIAADLGIDRLEIRRRNVLVDGDTYATGETMHDMHYTDLLTRTAEAIRWGEPGEASDPRKRRGQGLGVMIKSTVTPSRSGARLVMNKDGQITLYCASVEMGQGASATMAILVGEQFGIDPEEVDAPLPDTAIAPFDTTTSSSRSTFSMGNAIRQACQNLKAAVEDLSPGSDGEAFTHRDGHLHTPDGGIAYGRLLAEAGLTELEATGTFESTGGLFTMDPQDVRGDTTVHWHQGSAAVEVEVDLDTGKVEVVHAEGGSYAGRAISPRRVDQQNIGCLVYGLGPALFEELVYDDGQNSNPNLSDYMIPSIMDVPVDIGSVVVESTDPDPELHGVGEMALPALAPAIVSAIHEATGVWIRDLPLTPERVLRALETTSHDTSTGATT
jgi:CO/xanthine dehydrogenase Mo-binding subunit